MMRGYIIRRSQRLHVHRAHGTASPHGAGAPASCHATSSSSVWQNVRLICHNSVGNGGYVSTSTLGDGINVGFRRKSVPPIQIGLRLAGAAGRACQPHERREGVGVLHGRLGSRREFWSFGRNGSKPGKPPAVEEEITTGAFSETGTSVEDAKLPPSGERWDSSSTWSADTNSGGDGAMGSASDQGVTSEFSLPDGFATDASTASSMSDAASTISDVAVAAAATASSADLGSWPHHLCMHILEHVHATAGVPYWQAIMLTTVAARLVVLPLTVSSTANSLRMSMASPEIQVVQRKLKDLQDRGNSNPEMREAAMKEMRLLTLEMQDIYRKHNIRLSKVLYAFAQIPVFISLFFATKEMGSFFPGYATGGLSWATDLGATDPLYALPFLTWVSMQTLVELGTGIPPSAANSRFNMQHTMRAMGIISLPISLTMPSGVLVYWTTSNVFAIFQRLALDNTALRRALNIPLAEDLPQPGNQPTVADYTSKKDSSDAEELERWAGSKSSSSKNDMERAREEVAKASKERHEALKQEHASKSKEHNE